MKHLVITPVFNEEEYLETYVESVIQQLKTPERLVLVDDGSTDNSGAIIKKYSDNYAWIEYILKPSNNSQKSQGAKVIRVFNYGLDNISLSEYDVVSKIDADLELPSNYFLEVEEALKNNAVGITGGVIEERNSQGNWERIAQASYHIRGALKSYRKDCFVEIGGLMPVLGWDGLDEMKAFHIGWETKIVDVGVKHFRVAASDYDQRKLAFKTGYSKYQNGSNLFLAIIRAIMRISKKPYLMYSLSYLNGYLAAWFKREKKNVSKDLARFINKFHTRRIFKLDI